jgi:hypothetical protein
MNIESIKPKEIAFIKFLDMNVPVYYDQYMDNETAKSRFILSFQSRNPDAFYQGIVVLSYETGKITLENGDPVPQPEPRDSELLPKFVIIGTSELSGVAKEKILKRIFHEHKRRNQAIWPMLGYKH